MSSEPTAPGVVPDREDVLAETDAVYATDDRRRGWERRVTVSAPDGEWQFLESLARGDDPRRSLEYTAPTPPDGDGDWIYSNADDRELDCE